jgi:hypothetical protein
MSTRRWKCRNPRCRVTCGAILGHIACDGGLILDPTTILHAVYLDTRRAVVVCLTCGQWCEYRGTWFRVGAVHRIQRRRTTPLE